MLAFLMAMVLLFSVLAPAAMADREPIGSKITSLLDRIRSSRSEEDGESEKHAIEKYVKKLLSSILENSDGESSGLDQIVGELLSSFTGEDGKLDLEAIGSLIGSLLGSGEESSDYDELWEDYYNSPEYQDMLAQTVAIDEYVKDEYRDSLEQGDVQIVFQYTFYPEEENELPKSAQMGYFCLINYATDGTDLKYLNSSGAIEILDVSANEDGTYAVSGMKRAEEGGNDDAGIAELCALYGLPFERYKDSMKLCEWCGVQNLITYLEEHPEYERIEYQGELRTLDGLDELQSELISIYQNSLE